MDWIQYLVKLGEHMMSIDISDPVLSPIINDLASNFIKDYTLPAISSSSSSSPPMDAFPFSGAFMHTVSTELMARLSERMRYQEVPRFERYYSVRWEEARRTVEGE